MNLWVCSVLLASTIAQCCYAEGSRQWRLATGYRADSFHTQNLVQFSREIDQVTSGQLKIEIHPNNTLVKLADIRQAVQDGDVEAGETIMSAMVKDMPIAGADSIPFVVASYADAQRMWQLQRPLVEKHLAERGLKLLYAVPWPPQGLFSNKPLRSLADFAGTKMRTYNSATVRIAEFVKATPMDIATGDIGKALTESRIDNMITSSVVGVENQVWGSLRYYYEINAWFPKNVVFVNAKAFDGLKPAVRQAVIAASGAAEIRGWARSQMVMQEAIHALRANGVRIESVSHEFDQDIKRLGEKFSREWIRTVGNEANSIFIPYYTR